MDHPPAQFLRELLLLLFGFAALLVLIGCEKEKASTPGTADNLKADYERVVREKEQLKADFDKQKNELDAAWRQRVADKEQKITDLTAENATLRQRLLATEAALQELPLIDTARARSVLWLHLTYGLLIAACLCLLAVVLWVHANLRERVRLYVMQQARLIHSTEVAHVQQ